MSARDVAGRKKKTAAYAARFLRTGRRRVSKPRSSPRGPATWWGDRSDDWPRATRATLRRDAIRVPCHPPGAVCQVGLVYRGGGGGGACTSAPGQLPAGHNLVRLESFFLFSAAKHARVPAEHAESIQLNHRRGLSGSCRRGEAAGSPPAVRLDRRCRLRRRFLCETSFGGFEEQKTTKQKSYATARTLDRR